MALFLICILQGFSLTLGSDLAFLVLPAFQRQRDEMALDIGSTVGLTGTYSASNVSLSLDGTFLLSQMVGPDTPLVKYHYIMDGCYRDPSWPSVLQPLSWQWLFLQAPIFVFCLASLNGQSYRDRRRLLIIVLFGCCSFAANKVFNMWIFDQGDVVSAIGATVVGILGTIYGHYSEGDALPSMIPGILVLLPAGLSVVGGLSANFHDPASSVTSWLSSGLRMVQGMSLQLCLNLSWTNFLTPLIIQLLLGSLLDFSHLIWP